MLWSKQLHLSWTSVQPSSKGNSFAKYLASFSRRSLYPMDWRDTATILCVLLVLLLPAPEMKVLVRYSVTQQLRTCPPNLM